MSEQHSIRTGLIAVTMGAVIGTRVSPSKRTG